MTNSKATKHSRDIALQRAVDRDRLVAFASRELVRFARQLRSSVTGAVRKSLDPMQAFTLAFLEFETIVVRYTSLMYAMGAYHPYIAAGEHLTRAGVALSTYDEAMRYVRQRAKMTADEIAAVSAAYGVEAARVTREASAVVEGRVRRAVSRHVIAGGHIREGVKALGVEFEAIGIGQKPYVLETLTRNQMNMSYAAGQWQANTDPALDELIWGYEYVTIGDDRVREAHEATNGMRAAKGAAIWQTASPPNGHNCRCTVIEIFNDERHATEKLPDDVASTPDTGWAFHPKNTNDLTLPKRPPIPPPPTSI